MKILPPGFAAAITLATVALLPAAETVIPLDNAGFEAQSASWNNANDHGMSRVVAEAAHSGQAGLRVADDSDTLGSSLASKRLPAIAGKTYALRFSGRRISGEGIAVYLRFFDAKGKGLNRSELKNEINVQVRKADTEWKQFQAQGVAPADAVKVEVWIHSFTRSKVTADFDDFALVQLDA